ncbi:hypothetical protein BC937DRAFT_91879 [Endogone sp. FLAS-F59071]|nr:hypothetical protein BC937DRAFT_91879 [Endogone sp. FLAS-F59071]|eukprot:RUS15861.1 hypothetical protein BC937DRAFT_91879 [Endogone sp. FLAS-F59071]
MIFDLAVSLFFSLPPSYPNAMGEDLLRKCGIDPSYDIVTTWQQKRSRLELPRIEELSNIIEEALRDDMKIPISKWLFKRFLDNDFNNRCTVADVGIIFKDGFRGSTHGRYEDGYHFFWDNNIRSLLERLVPMGRAIRNTSQSMSILNMRPDFGFIHSKVCPFRGEEKSDLNGENPRSELRDKLVWTYGDVPYVLGYYANGAKVTYVTITHPVTGSGKPNIVTLADSDLRRRRDRIINIKRIINISSLIEPITHAIGWREATEFLPIMRNDKTIVVGGTGIKKEYTDKTYAMRDYRISKLRSVYRALAAIKVPNVDRLSHSFCDLKHGAVAYLVPRGMDVKPSNARKMLEALACILEALVVMHKGAKPIYHRDIRWPNVIRQPGDMKPSRWFLIDWDDATSLPTKAAKHLDQSNHAPEVFQNNHGGEVDIWSVEQLMRETHILALSKDIKAAGRWMQRRKYRPTAEDALKTINDLLVIEKAREEVEEQDEDEEADED